MSCSIANYDPFPLPPKKARRNVGTSILLCRPHPVHSSTKVGRKGQSPIPPFFRFLGCCPTRHITLSLLPIPRSFGRISRREGGLHFGRQTANLHPSSSRSTSRQPFYFFFVSSSSTMEQPPSPHTHSGCICQGQDRGGSTMLFFYSPSILPILPWNRSQQQAP